VITRIRQRITMMHSMDAPYIRRFCLQLVRDGTGELLKLYPDRSPTQQQVAQPILGIRQVGEDEKVLGYLVLDRDRKHEHDVIVRTVLEPTARQILQAQKGYLPRWYLEFQAHRRW
jgi:hypothetical protein